MSADDNSYMTVDEFDVSKVVFPYPPKVVEGRGTKIPIRYEVSPGVYQMIHIISCEEGGFYMPFGVSPIYENITEKTGEIKGYNLDFALGYERGSEPELMRRPRESRLKSELGQKLLQLEQKIVQALCDNNDKWGLGTGDDPEAYTEGLKNAKGLVVQKPLFNRIVQWSGKRVGKVFEYDDQYGPRIHFKMGFKSEDRTVNGNVVRVDVFEGTRLCSADQTELPFNSLTAATVLPKGSRCGIAFTISDIWSGEMGISCRMFMNDVQVVRAMSGRPKANWGKLPQASEETRVDGAGGEAPPPPAAMPVSHREEEETGEEEDEDGRGHAPAPPSSFLRPSGGGAAGGGGSKKVGFGKRS